MAALIGMVLGKLSVTGSVASSDSTADFSVIVTHSLFMKVSVYD